MRKRLKFTLAVVGGLAVIYVLKIFGILSFLSTLPWWMYFVVAGVIFSGYRFLIESRRDREVDQEFIEEQGKVFMERIEEARKKRSS